jgi:hypothetical protein
MALPEHIKRREVGQHMEGMEDTDRFRVPSFIKVCQALTRNKGDLKEGELFATPNKVALPQPLYFAPLYRYSEFTIQNPMGHPEKWIRERTYDPASDLGQKCLTLKGDDRSFPCPEVAGKECKYREIITFIIMIEGAGSPCVLSFYGGEWIYGSKFIQLLNNRPTTEMCVNRFQMSTSLHEFGGNQWYGFDIFNPEDGVAFYDSETCNTHRLLAQEIKRQHIEKGGLDVDYESIKEEVVEGDVVESTEY